MCSFSVYTLWPIKLDIKELVLHFIDIPDGQLTFHQTMGCNEIVINYPRNEEELEKYLGAIGESNGVTIFKEGIVFEYSPGAETSNGYEFLRIGFNEHDLNAVDKILSLPLFKQRSGLTICVDKCGTLEDDSNFLKNLDLYLRKSLSID